MCFLRATMSSLSIHFAKLENTFLLSLFSPVKFMILPYFFPCSCSHFHASFLYVTNWSYTQASHCSLLAALQTDVCNPLSLLKTPYLMHSGLLTFAFFKFISHWLWIEKFKMTNYMWICFSFWMHGPEFIEFPGHIEHFMFTNEHCILYYFQFQLLLACCWSFFPFSFYPVKFQSFPLLLLLLNHVLSAHIISIQDYYKTTN